MQMMGLYVLLITTPLEMSTALMYSSPVGQGLGTLGAVKDANEDNLDTPEPYDPLSE